ncbi:MAG: hypothetical protein Q8J84_04645 [Flavobacteriaceae bacterium]|nr:hypothetical protein [Flavobacteriaceae bacterium]
MSEQQNNRRNFLKNLGLSVTATLASTSVFASFIDKSEIRQLNPGQQEFMMRYGKWMDKFTEIIRIQKTEPESMENHRKMIEITNQVKELQPELNEFMKDKTFALIYQASIKRVSDEI